MKTLIVSCKADRSETSLIRYLASCGDQVTLLCDPDEPHISKFEDLGIHVIPRRIAHRLDLATAFAIRKLCLHKPIDTIYANFNAGISSSLMGTIGLPTRVVTYRGTLGNLSRLDPSSYLTHLNPRIDGIVANCQAVNDFLVSQNIPGEKITTVLKGHSASWYNQRTAPTRQEIGIGEKDFVVGLVANLRPLKGVDILLEAVASLVPEIPITVLLVGEERDSSMREKVKALRLEDRVHFLGFRKDAAEISTLFDVALMPSTRREGVARAVLEAMSHGKPCVVTSVGGLPEAVADGETGMVIPPSDSKALAEALETLYNNEELRREYGQAAKERFNTTFALDSYHDKMRTFFMPRVAL